METRSCEVCHVRMPPFVPRKRDDEGRQVCWGCHATPRGGYVSAEPPMRFGSLEYPTPQEGAEYEPLSLSNHLRDRHGMTPEDSKHVLLERHMIDNLRNEKDMRAGIPMHDISGINGYIHRQHENYHNHLHQTEDTDHEHPDLQFSKPIEETKNFDQDTRPFAYGDPNRPYGETMGDHGGAHVPWRDPLMGPGRPPKIKPEYQESTDPTPARVMQGFPNSQMNGKECPHTYPDAERNYPEKGSEDDPFHWHDQGMPYAEQERRRKSGWADKYTCPNCGAYKALHVSDEWNNSFKNRMEQLQEGGATAPFHPLKPSLNALTTAVYGEEPMHVKQFTPGDDVYGDILRGDSDVATNIDRHLHEHHDPEFADRVKRRVRHDLQLTPDEHMHYQDLDVAHQVMHEHERSLGQESHDHDEASNIPYPGDPEYGKHLSQKSAGRACPSCGQDINKASEHCLLGEYHNSSIISDGMGCPECGLDTSEGTHWRHDPHTGETVHYDPRGVWNQIDTHFDDDDWSPHRDFLTGNPQGPSKFSSQEKNPADHTMYGDGLNCSYCGESAGLHPHPHEGEWAPCSLCNKDMSHHLHDTGRWEHLETSKYQAPVDVKHIWDVYGEDYPKQGALRDQNECPHDGEWNLHGQCKQCGYTPPTEADEPCDDEWCVENEPEHTKGEHVDPPHRDPGHPDYHAAEQGVEDAIGEHPDGWLLDHQPEGPSKFSKIAHSGHTEPDVGPTSDLPGENHTTLHGHRDEKTILPGLGCPHCDGGFFHEDARESHIKENHPGQYAGPSEDMLMMKQMRDERQQEQEQKENGTYGGFPHITPGDHEALHHHLIEHHGDASYAEDFPFEEDDKYHKGKMQPFHDRAHSDLEDEKEHEGYGYGYHFHVDPHNEENGYRRHFDLPNYAKPDPKYDLGPATDTHLIRAHGRDPDEVEPGWENARWHQNMHEEPDNFPEDEHEEFNHKHGSVKEAMWAPIDKRVDDMEPGDVVISGGEFHPVSEVKFHAPGEHPQSPIHNHMHAVEVVTPHGSRWSGSGRTMSTFHPDLAGETAVPFRLRENEGFTHEGSQQMELFPELHEQQGHLKNPHDQSYDWHHGTPHEFKSFDDDPYEDSDWDELDTEREDKKHWNASLGQHWTALPHVADSFARGQYHNFGSGPGKVITANLGIKHPKVYDSEFQMDSDAFDQAWPKTGPVRDDHDPEMQHDAVCDRPGQCEGLHEHDNADPIHAKMRKWYGSGAGNTGDRGTWLSSHPEKDMIASQFRHTLQEQGHDGIVYGNEIETPHGHPCAVTFDTDQIHNVRERPADRFAGARKSVTSGMEHDDHVITPGFRYVFPRTMPKDDLDKIKQQTEGKTCAMCGRAAETTVTKANGWQMRSDNMHPHAFLDSNGKATMGHLCESCHHASQPNDWHHPYAKPERYTEMEPFTPESPLRQSLNSTDDNYNPKCQYCKLKVPHVRHHEDILHDIYGDAEHPKKTSNSSESAEGVHLHSCPSCNQFWNHTMAGTGKPCPFGPVETCRDCVDRQYNDSEANLVTPEQNFQHGEHWDGPNHNEPYPF